MPEKKPALGNRYITRMDYTNVKGWNVRIYINSKPVEQKLFSDGVFGSKIKARDAARAYRDTLIKKFKINPYKKRGEGYHEVDARNTTGVVGVSLQKTERATGFLQYGWSARFMQKGRQRNRTFSIQKYGYEEAFKLAVKCRYDMTERQTPKGIKAPKPPADVQRWLNTLAKKQSKKKVSKKKARK